MTSRKIEERGARLLETLRGEGARLIILRDGCILYRSDERGIRPLLDALNSLSPDSLHGASYVDRVVGKAAALLLARAGAGFVATIVASEPALDLLREHRIPTYREEACSHIAGRAPGQPCLFEESVADIDDPKDAHLKLGQLAVDMDLFP